MSDTKHTAGPWFINGPFDDKSDFFIRATIDGENFDLANLGCDETGNAKANARLISCAPEMLEALEFIFLQGVDDDTTEDDMRSMIDQMRTSALNAIQKATAK
jgi:hypothetical protein